MKYTVYQPGIGLPLYLFARVVECKHFVLLDDVEISKAGLHQMLLVGPNGEYKVSLPLQKASSSTKAFQAVPADYDAWLTKLNKQLLSTYARGGGSTLIDRFITDMRLLKPEWGQSAPNLYLISRALWQWCLGVIRVEDVSILRASHLHERGDDPSHRLAVFGGLLGSKTYISGALSAAAYLRETAFTSRGMNVEKQVWSLRDYDSVHQPQSNARVSVLDLIFSQGPQNARKILGIEE